MVEDVNDKKIIQVGKIYKKDVFDSIEVDENCIQDIDDFRENIVVGLEVIVDDMKVLSLIKDNDMEEQDVEDDFQDIVEEEKVIKNLIQDNDIEIVINKGIKEKIENLINVINMNVGMDIDTL